MLKDFSKNDCDDDDEFEPCLNLDECGKCKINGIICVGDANLPAGCPILGGVID